MVMSGQMDSAWMEKCWTMNECWKDVWLDEWRFDGLVHDE